MKKIKNCTINNNYCSRCPKNKKQAFKIQTTEELLSLINIYSLEWTQRDSLMWKQVYTFFFAVFIIILLPFAKVWNISLTETIPHFVFPIVGILLSFLFLYVSMQYAKRLSKIGETYRDLIEHLPEEFQRKHIYKKDKISFWKQIAYTVPLIMFFALFSFGVLVLVLCLI